ncbi:MAG: hypothetical protein AB1497_11610 [Bacillota bacterium]
MISNTRFLGLLSSDDGALGSLTIIDPEAPPAGSSTPAWPTIKDHYLCLYAHLNRYSKSLGERVVGIDANFCRSLPRKMQKDGSEGFIASDHLALLDGPVMGHCAIRYARLWPDVV